MRRAVDRDEPRGAGDEPRHRPGVVEVVVEARDRELSQVRVGVGMIPGELGAVVVGAERAEQGRRPRVVQVRVVQHGQAGIPEEVRPQIVVMRRVAELVDGQVVGSLLVPPHEVVGRARARRHARDRLVDEDVDLVLAAQSRDEVGAAGRDAGGHRRHRAEPGEAGHLGILSQAQGSGFKAQAQSLAIERYQGFA